MVHLIYTIKEEYGRTKIVKYSKKLAVVEKPREGKSILDRFFVFPNLHNFIFIIFII